MAELSGESLENAVIDFTQIRTLMSIRVTREDADKVETWRTLVDGLLAAEDPDEWAYRFYLQTEEGELELDDTEDFGCFYYTYPFRDTKAVRLHFRNADRSGLGALSLARSEVRRCELVNMLAEIKVKHPDAGTVRGGSWLYNIEPYRRLFPTAYIASAKPVGYELVF